MAGRVAVLLAFSASTLFNLASALPSPSTSGHTVKDVVREIPHGWIQGSRAPSDYPLRLRIGLPQPDFATLEETLFQVSDPSHEKYGQHLSQEQVNELVQPHPHTTNAVEEWLAEHGLFEHHGDYVKSDAGDWVTLLGVTVAKVEEMLGCEYHIFRHPSTGESTIRTLSYGVPHRLAEHVDVVHPTTMFSRPRAMRSTLFVDELLEPTLSGAKPKVLVDTPAIDCNATSSPACLQDLYKINGYTPLANIGNQLGVAGYLEEYASVSDLKQFYEEYYPKAANTSFEFVSINGGLNNQSLPGGEANLDIQYTGALSYPIPNIYYNTGGRGPFIPDVLSPVENSNEPYLEFVTYLRNLTHPPQVISTSYDDDEQTVPKDYAVRLCKEFAQLGLRGVSLLFSSGDGGVAGAQTPPYCASNDGRNTTKFIPTFPSSCPYVTSVGATRYVSPEQAVTFSSGGFSEYFDTPLYQKLDNAAFLKKLGSTYKGLYKRGGRGIPDVSAQGVRYHTILGGKESPASGTSASTPTFSAIISLLNDHRIRNKQPPLGFLNPWLYTVGRLGLTDITLGNNPGCGTPGFNATKGWDPVTGLGTPDFSKLKTIAWPFGN